MLYHLLYPLRDIFFGFNIFRYITFRSGGALFTSLMICFYIGPKVIRWLKSKQGEGYSDTVRPHTILNDGRHAALGVCRISNDRQRQHEGEDEDLHCGAED